MIRLQDYNQHLQDAKPTFFSKQVIKPPKGALGDIRVIPEKTIPPINTNINFSTLTPFNLAEHPEIARMAITQLPHEFNWREHQSSDTPAITRKKQLIAKPGNQALCGSCWAISGAGIVGDNFVVSDLVDWKPDLSTTWSLACYPQHQCQGGNPAQLFEDIAKGGIVSNHCIDYSWCMTNSNCNGKATHHFQQHPMNLSTLVPSCGCYDANSQHYVYKIEPNSKSLFIGSPGITSANIGATAKKHIYTKGPIMGGFLVYKNFMKGFHTKINNGVYFETGVYDGSGQIKFSDAEISPNNYIGSHAIAIIGWGVAKNTQIDNHGKKADVPYWYCRNSWTEKWGDGGYFKMAMFPFNKFSQFDKRVIIETNRGRVMGGGMVLITAKHPPQLQKLKGTPIPAKRLHPGSFYTGAHKDSPVAQKKDDNNEATHYWWLLIAFLVVLALLALWFVIWFFNPKHKK